MRSSVGRASRVGGPGAFPTVVIEAVPEGEVGPFLCLKFAK